MKKLDSYWKDELSRLNRSIVNREMEKFSPKGIIVTNEDAFQLAKEALDFEGLEAKSFLYELDIDESWDEYFERSDDNEEYEKFWNRLVYGAYNASDGESDGLLVLNIKNIKAFEHCWMLKQLVKQEKDLQFWEPLDFALSGYPKPFRFKGAVMFVLKDLDLTWKEVYEYAYEHDEGQFLNLLEFASPVRLTAE